MFNEVDKPVERVEVDIEKAPKRAFDVSLLTTSELLNLRARIDERLPPMSLENLNLEAELALQFQTVKALQTDTLEDNFVEPNKKASVVNACASVLAQIVKLQTELHTAERFKTIEGLMIKAMKTLPAEIIDQFLKDYEEMGKTL